MIVVSDTTPLRHLIAIGEAELLPKLYGTVIVPGAVWAELQAEATPLIVKTWLGSPPDWLEVRSSHPVVSNEPALDVLDPGEREAIQLASELCADLLLMDDREGRLFALRRQLPVTEHPRMTSSDGRSPGSSGAAEPGKPFSVTTHCPSRITHLRIFACLGIVHWGQGGNPLWSLSESGAAATARFPYPFPISPVAVSTLN